MSERNIKETISNRERNVDALFGVLHIKDKPYLHQRSAQHVFGETDSAVIVPLGTVAGVWDEHSGKGKRVLKIAIAAFAMAGVIAFMVYLFHLNPGFLIPFL